MGQPPAVGPQVREKGVRRSRDSRLHPGPQPVANRLRLHFFLAVSCGGEELFLDGERRPVMGFQQGVQPGDRAAGLLQGAAEQRIALVHQVVQQLEQLPGLVQFGRAKRPDLQPIQRRGIIALME